MIAKNATIGANYKYIVTRKGAEFSEAVLNDFEASLDRNGYEAARTAGMPFIWDALGRLSRPLRYCPPANNQEETAIVGMMGLAERQLLPYARKYALFPYIWDCWPSRQSDWLSLFNRYQFRHIGLTCRQAAEYWAAQLQRTTVHWTPEAIEQREYPPGPNLSMRKSLLLEIGRIYHSAHQRAAETLARLGEKHTHPLADIHTPYLRSRGELVRALHDHRALLCYPGAVSHPNGRTGNWHSMTHRYLEAVSTKTLVLGHVPSEMETLFGFRPGVNATPDELPRVIQVLINEPENYQEIVDRSYKRLLQVATWDVRVRELCAIQSGTEYAGAPTTDRG